MRPRIFRLSALPLILVLLVTLVPAWASSAASATISIDSVGGKKVSDGTVRGKLSGNAIVTGTFSPTSTEATETQKPLVADAGNSGFAASGSRVTLLGAGYGGAEPYSFAWSSPAGTIDGADAPTAQLVTDGVAPGTYDVTLQVTDASGASATDTVKVVIYGGEGTTLLDETFQDTRPGTLITGEVLEFPFDVPSGTTFITVGAEWGLVANDYDLRVLDPAGVEAGSSGNAAGEPEEVSIANPAAGTWTLALDKYATLTDTVHVSVTGQVAVDDPRPIADAGGPYRFAPGTQQSLTGSVSGGTEPYTVGWDTDLDGRIDQTGLNARTGFPNGSHMVVFKVTDANGFEHREMVSVVVAPADRLDEETTAVTVIAINDSGINPYHLEFSAETYPDPAVLALTNNFTRHPSEYIPGYPANAEALNITLGQGYFPDSDADVWTSERVQAGRIYWFPGTKIIGAVDTSVSTGVTSGDDIYPILDDNGHGTGSASVSTGNRYGYCPTCLLVVVEGLDESIVAQYDWVDISSNSFGYVGGLPIGPVVGPNQATKAATERGQTILFAAGNGVGNAFDVPVSTYGSDQTGPDWNITVGAIRRDNNRAIVGDGIPVHISAWGDGNLPSACRTGTVGQCAFGGTSAATPYTAGVFGTVLTEVRQVLGDAVAGQKAGQVVAQGVSVAGSEYLADGRLTRQELRDAVLKTAYPLNTDNEYDFPYYPIPATWPYTGDENVLFEGYGAATPESAKRAVAVLLGDAPMPSRPYEDGFFELDRQIRDTLYGGFDRDGDGTEDSYALDNGSLGLTAASLTTPEAVMLALQKVAQLSSPVVSEQTLGPSYLRYYLHRQFVAEPIYESACLEDQNEQFMDRNDSTGDLEPCFDSRVTSVVAAYRPVGIWASSDTIDAPLPAGSTVFVELYMAAETPSVIHPTGVLMAGDREIGEGAASPTPVLASGPGGAACATLGETCWTKFTFSFDTTRPAVHGEQLTFQVQLLGARSWAFGYEGAHASRISILPAEMPESGLDFGTTIISPEDGETLEAGEVHATGQFAFPSLGEEDESGSQPTEKWVEVSVNDSTFATPLEASLDENNGWWDVSLGWLEPGTYTVYSRARMDTTVSEVASHTFTVVAKPTDTKVEWQVVPAGTQPSSSDWRPASTTDPRYAFEVNTKRFGQGTFDIHVRLLENGQQTAANKVTATFTGK